MADLIDRQAVKEWLTRWDGYIDQDTIARMQYRVMDIPSAQPEQRWISCEEQLPEENAYYLVTVEYESGERRIEIDYRVALDDDDVINSDWVGVEKVLAWMPLPEPYREGEE